MCVCVHASVCISYPFNVAIIPYECINSPLEGAGVDMCVVSYCIAPLEETQLKIRLMKTCRVFMQNMS